MGFTLQGYVQVRKNIGTIIIVLSLKEDINNFLNYFYQIFSIDNIFIYIFILVFAWKTNILSIAYIFFYLFIFNFPLTLKKK